MIYMLSKALLIVLFALTASGCNKEKQENVAVGKDSALKSVVPSKPLVYKWNDEGCNHEGAYTSDKYTPHQLAGTHYLCYRTGYLTNASPSFPRALYEFDEEKELAKLDEEYVRKMTYLERIELVPGAKWENLRRSRLRELKENYDFVCVSLKGIAAPVAFLDNPFSDHCSELAEALNATDADMLEEWRKLIEKRAKSYGDESIERSYLSRYRWNRSSPDSVAHAKIDIFHYGWYECADTLIYHVNEKGLKEDFEKLFSDVKKDCPPEQETDGI
jgi:hypothetical protein